MTTHTTNDPDTIKLILDSVGINPADIWPSPGRLSCDGLMALWPLAWMIVSNNAGRFTITVIEDATEKEAFAFLESLNGGRRGDNARLVASGKTTPERN